MGNENFWPYMRLGNKYFFGNEQNSILQKCLTPPARSVVTGNSMESMKGSVENSCRNWRKNKRNLERWQNNERCGLSSGNFLKNHGQGSDHYTDDQDLVMT